MGLSHVQVTGDVFAHHDGVIDQDADRQGQRQHGHHVEREAEQADHRQGADNRNRQGEPGDDGRAP